MDHLVPCISSYPFMSHIHFPNYTLLSLIFCAIPLYTNYMACVHQDMPWLMAQTMTCLPTWAILSFWPKALFTKTNLPCSNWTSNRSCKTFLHLLFALIHELHHAKVPHSLIFHFSHFEANHTKRQGQW